MARLSKATLADGKVVALPTATARQVSNSRFAEQRRASLAARKASPFADRYQHHQEREADRLAGDLTTIEQTPALLIVSAILRTMDGEAVTKVLEQLAPGAVTGRPAHSQAVATVKASRLNLGQQFDLMRALDRLHGEGR
ncbi:hypothetical protein D9601_19350 [Sphingomonas sp. MA1305]|uniref:hypothetical protein n=1 Tax=Sphingomonas sp. MA1305 TaxID=2479204 RepID=UPI0018E040E3|nr:hypothetical protein [Sphingomonas sp. MA1305]MBI0477495.1 hypothetical protein [Sphingomonas sp. MA1305]